jgi:hypothetical protein
MEQNLFLLLITTTNKLYFSALLLFTFHHWINIQDDSIVVYIDRVPSSQVTIASKCWMKIFLFIPTMVTQKVYGNKPTLKNVVNNRSFINHVLMGICKVKNKCVVFFHSFIHILFYHPQIHVNLLIIMDLARLFTKCLSKFIKSAIWMTIYKNCHPPIERESLDVHWK